MNGILLDTHILLWFVAEDPRLSPSLRAPLEDPGTDLYLSAASGIEIAIAIKHSLGKLRLHVPFLQLLTTELTQNEIGSLPILTEHLQMLSDLEVPPSGRRDPFDRLSVAQARSEGLRLVTADRALAGYGIEPVGVEPDGQTSD